MYPWSADIFNTYVEKFDLWNGSTISRWTVKVGWLLSLGNISPVALKSYMVGVHACLRSPIWCQCSECDTKSNSWDALLSQWFRAIFIKLIIKYIKNKVEKDNWKYYSETSSKYKLLFLWIEWMLNNE